MSDSPEVANLTRWLGDIQRQVRDLATGNPLNKAEVVDASGKAVLLSQIAFGQVIATKAGVGAVSINGVTNASGSTPWVYPSGLSVTVLVTGGKLRVDWASLLALTGLSSNQMIYSYAVSYTGPPEARGSTLSAVINPDYYRAVVLQGGGNVMAFGSFALHEGLAPGWYLIEGAFQYRYGVQSTGLPQASADNPRIGATPL